jgi:hypothetical protein
LRSVSSPMMVMLVLVGASVSAVVAVAITDVVCWVVDAVMRCHLR